MAGNEKTNSEKKGSVNGLKAEFRKTVRPIQEVLTKQTAAVVVVSLALDMIVTVLG